MRESGWAYLTAEGHLFLNDQDRSVYLYIERSTKLGQVAPKPGDYTPTDLKVLFAYLTLAPEPYGGSQIELARYADVSEAGVTRALRKLAGNGFPRQRDQLLAEQLIVLLQTWAEQYALKLKSKLRTWRFHPVGLRQDWRELSALPEGIYYSGVAAAAVEGFGLVSGRELEVYAGFDALAEHTRRLRWAPSPEGQVICRERFWGQPSTDWCVTGRSSHATVPLLTYADLLATRDPRAIEVAERELLNLCLKLYRQQ